MERYHQLLETLQKIKRAEERLKVLIQNKSVLEQKVRDKKLSLEKEEYDVEKLEGLSLTGIIYLLKGTLIDKFDQEEREAMIAKNQYEFACEELNVNLREIERAKERIKDKHLVEREYNAFIKSQEKKLVGGNSELSMTIKRLIEKDFYHSEIIREIREAEDAGQSLKYLFECIVESFKSADSLGIIDILESGLLVSNCSHETVKSTNEKLVLMQQNIRKYHLELLDVFSVCEVVLNCDYLTNFSDDFLVGVMKRKSTEGKLEFAKTMMENMVSDIETSLEVLSSKRSSVEMAKGLVQSEKIKHIESALEN